MSDVGGRIAHERKAAGFSQSQLARLIGTDQPTVSKIESGALGVSVERAVAIADALGITIERLIGRHSRAGV